jgi:ribosomal protein S18 acetylase RimI-like enzyme
MTTATHRRSSPRESRPEDAESGWGVRDYDPDRDAEAVSRIDTSFTTTRLYAMHLDADGVRLEPVPAPSGSGKRFPIDLSADAWQKGHVALLDGEVRGFIAAAIKAWNCRMAIWHFYVDLPFRGRGGGRALMRAAVAWGRTAGARTAWIETTHLNDPGIQAYRRLGFEICGFDTSLYRGTPAEGEIAVYMARSIGEEEANGDVP